MAEAEIEARHVHSVYSQIACHFSDTRYKPWPRVTEFLRQLPPGSLVADVGCGNGKYFQESCSQGYMIGCDMCHELVSIATGRGHEVMVGDCLNLPYRSNVFDAVISIAVIHHLSSQQRRLKAVQELARVIGVGGKVLVYVWAMEQQRKKFTEQDVMVPWHLQSKYTVKPPPLLHSQPEIKKKKMNKKQRALRKKRQQCDSMCSGDDGESGVCDVMCDDGESGVMCDDGVRCEKREDIGQVTSQRDHMISTTPGNKQHGFQTFQRYYHVFRQYELTTLFNEVGGVNVIEEFYDHENWCVIAEKVT